MKIVRLLSFIGLSTGSLFLPFPFFVCGSVLYVLVFGPYEVLWLGLFIDAYFGTIGDLMYRYTVVGAILTMSSTIVRPYVRFYNE